MFKFKSTYPNRTYYGCGFNDKCEFTTESEKIADVLRNSRLTTDHDIWEVKDEPENTSNADSEVNPAEPEKVHTEKETHTSQKHHQAKK